MSEGNNEMIGNVRRLIETMDVANVLTEPLTASIANLLRISAGEVNSDEASVLVRDGDEGDLRFLAAIGQVASQLVNMKVPAGKGIAGFVFSSGQPMAVSDVGEEQSFYAEVDRETGYSTQMILATPLRYEGEVIGVLEFINRRGQPPFEPFTPDEMDRAALFAEPIASLVNAYESAKMFRDLTQKMASEDEAGELAAMRTWLQNVRNSQEYREMMDLALLVRHVASHGERERDLAKEILESIVRYSENQGDSVFLNY